MTVFGATFSERWRQTTSSRIRLGLSCAVERAGDGLDRAGRDVVALADEVGELAHDRAAGRDLVLGAVEREHVAAQEHVAVEVLLERLHHLVAGPGELGGDFVGKLELGAH